MRSREEIQDRIDELTELKDQHVKNQDYEEAADTRDRASELVATLVLIDALETDTRLQNSLMGRMAELLELATLRAMGGEPNGYNPRPNWVEWDMDVANCLRYYDEMERSREDGFEGVPVRCETCHYSWIKYQSGEGPQRDIECPECGDHEDIVQKGGYEP